MFIDVEPMTPEPGQESCWNYPRPAVAEATSKHLAVYRGGVTVAETTRGFRVLETSHPPTYYFPLEDVRSEMLRPIGLRTACEWKGQCSWYDLAVPGSSRVRAAAWSYLTPKVGFEPLAGFIAFFARPMDKCTVDGVTAIPQDGQYYGGWITPDIVGPFKGGPETRGW